MKKNVNATNRTNLWLTMLLVPTALGLALGCDVDQTREGKAPEVEVKEGQLPEYDVDTPEINIRTKKREVEVPEVNVNMKKRTIEVPEVDVQMPEQDGADD